MFCERARVGGFVRLLFYALNLYIYIYIFIPCIVYFWERNFHVSSNIIRDREHENDIIFQMIKIRSAIASFIRSISLQLYIIIIIIMCKHQ